MKKKKKHDFVWIFYAMSWGILRDIYPMDLKWVGEINGISTQDALIGNTAENYSSTHHLISDLRENRMMCAMYTMCIYQSLK